jgi:hypothetical protein
LVEEEPQDNDICPAPVPQQIESVVWASLLSPCSSPSPLT